MLEAHLQPTRLASNSRTSIYIMENINVSQNSVIAPKEEDEFEGLRRVQQALTLELQRSRERTLELIKRTISIANI